MKDEQYGGFFGYVGNDHVIDRHSDKGAVKISRILWSYSALALFDGNPKHKEYADAAYVYLRDVLYDQLYGGVYWKSAYDGRIINHAKHVYAQSFAIYGLSAYAKAFADHEARDLAMTIFTLIESKAKNGPGSYLESFDRAWRVTPNVSLQTDDMVPVYTTNTIIHLIESYTTLFELTQDEQVKTSLIQLMECYYERIYDQQRQVSRMFFDINWTSLTTDHSYGHDIETAWLIDRTISVLALDEGKYRLMTFDLANKVKQKAYRRGRIKSEVRGRSSSHLIWWIQAEAAIGFYNHYQKTKDQSFRRAALRTIKATLKLIVDPRPEGEWFWAVDRIGRPIGIHGISENWKANYHNIRACIELIERGASHDASNV